MMKHIRNKATRLKINTALRDLLRRPSVTAEEAIAEVKKGYHLSDAEIAVVTNADPIRTMIQMANEREIMSYIRNAEEAVTTENEENKLSDTESQEAEQQESQEAEQQESQDIEVYLEQPVDALEPEDSKPKSTTKTNEIQDVYTRDRLLKVLCNNLSTNLESTINKVVDIVDMTPKQLNKLARRYRISYQDLLKYRSDNYRFIVADVENKCDFNQCSYPEFKDVEEQPNPKVKGEPVGYVYRYYRDMLGLSDNLRNNVDRIYEFYKLRINPNEEEARVKETIYEYIRDFEERGLDGADVVADRIAMVSRKSSPEKRNISYLIGCMRENLKEGLYSTNSQSDKKIIEAFESRFKIKLSSSAKSRVLGLVLRHGAIDTLTTLISMEEPESLENYYLRHVETALNSKEY